MKFRLNNPLLEVISTFRNVSHFISHNAYTTISYVMDYYIGGYYKMIVYLQSFNFAM